MSFYRTFIAAVAAMGLATVAFAADESSTQMNNSNATTQSAQATDAKVNVNTATAKELAKVKGLNTAKAKAIVSYRKKHGDFKSLDDLKEVSSLKKMNEAALKEVQDQLTLS